VRIQLAQKIVLKEALSKKWDKRPETLAQVEQLRQNFLAESYLKSISTPPDGFPSAAEVKAAYEAAKESLRVPKQFRLAQIFVAAPPKPDKDADDKIRKRLEPIGKQPDSFAAFARAESEDKITAPRGGEIGWVAEAQIQAEIRSQVVKLARNAVSDPIRLNDGWHLIKLLDVKESFIPPLEDVKEAIARQLRAERTRVNSQAYLAKLLKENPVTINEIAIAQQVEQLGKGGKSPSLP
jgi:peptidylprolyl isomerase